MDCRAVFYFDRGSIQESVLRNRQPEQLDEIDQSMSTVKFCDFVARRVAGVLGVPSWEANVQYHRPAHCVKVLVDGERREDLELHAKELIELYTQELQASKYWFEWLVLQGDNRCVSSRQHELGVTTFFDDGVQEQITPSHVVVYLDVDLVFDGFASGDLLAINIETSRQLFADELAIPLAKGLGLPVHVVLANETWFEFIGKPVSEESLIQQAHELLLLSVADVRKAKEWIVLFA